MPKKSFSKYTFQPGTVIRRFLLGWLTAATISYAVLPLELKNLQGLSGIAQMSFPAIIVLTFIIFVSLWIAGKYWKTARWERWSLFGVFAVLSFLSFRSNASFPYAAICLLILGVLAIYGIYGWNSSQIQVRHRSAENRGCKWSIAALAIFFVLFVSIWTVCRIYCFATPTYDFGIFSQMFHYMKTTGQPLTTLERDGLLSHFHVHVSPVYYLLLPFYWLIPVPATLQVLQAVVLASAVIPLYKLGKLYGLSPLAIFLLCGTLLLYPAFSGGTSYDIHENAFLTPLLLWLFYAIDCGNLPLTIISVSLTLMVKEDAAVYTAIAAVYLFVRALLSKSPLRTRNILTGILIFIFSVIWFFLVTSFLSKTGDGVMTYRYSNFMYDQSDSLFAVIKAVFISPAKLVFECVDQEKLSFIVLTLIPLGIPFFFTRKYERFLLLIPYVLMNLMSDYQYQHSIYFQYTFGSVAFLMYMVLINIADMNESWKKVFVTGLSFCLCAAFFFQSVVPKASNYIKYCKDNHGYYQQIRDTLSLIPDDASVSATTFYTVFLSQRDIVYDVKYADPDHVLETEYIALSINSETSYTMYASQEASGYENFVSFLESNGYEVFVETGAHTVIYRKSNKF